MKRIHLFEWEDQLWFPKNIRQFMTDFLEHAVAREPNVYGPIIPKLKEVLEKQNCNQIVDLCSGSSGPLRKICRDLKEKECEVEVTLTDKYPNVQKWQLVSEQVPCIKYRPDSIDATNVPDDLEGMRTIFLGFHHFPPDLAQKILQNAVDKKQPIGVFELVERHPLNIFSMFFSPVHLWLITPFIKPFRLSRLFWTYIFPIIPFCILWDGFVSCLRAYTTAELTAIVEEIKAKDYAWDIGKEKMAGLPANITFLFGYPEGQERSQEVV